MKMMCVRFPVPALALALTLVCGAGVAHADPSRIELVDGSVIVGELVGIDHGQYHVRSATMGDVMIPESNIRTLMPLGSATGAGAQPADGAASGAMAARSPASSGGMDHQVDLQQIQQRIAADPAMMQQVMSLQEDPDVQALLADPEISRKILSGDLENLRQDARIRKLMNNPVIRQLFQELNGS